MSKVMDLFKVYESYEYKYIFYLKENREESFSLFLKKEGEDIVKVKKEIELNEAFRYMDEYNRSYISES